jgi:cell division protein FtsL
MTAPVLTKPDRRAVAASPRAQSAPARPQLRVVTGAAAEEAQRRATVRLLATVIVSVAGLCVFGVVVAHVVLTQNQFRLDGLQQRSARQQAEYDRLRLNVAELESPGRIVAAASERLGMVTPAAITYLTPTTGDAGTSGSPAATATGQAAPAQGTNGQATSGPLSATSAAPARPTATATATATPIAPQTVTSWAEVKPHLAEG